MNNSSKNNNNENIIIFGVMRQNDNRVFNPENLLCGSIAFGNLDTLSESLAICEELNWAISWDDDLQADFSHPLEGESYIPIAFVEGNWYEIRGEENLPYRMNSVGKGEWFIDGLWSVETPPTPTSPILEFGALRQVSEFGKKYQLVTSDQEISDILEGVGYKPSSSDDGVLSFDGIPSAWLFVLHQHEGEMKEVWGSYLVAPELSSGAELIWHDQMTEAELNDLEFCNPNTPPPPPQEQESEEEKYFSSKEREAELKNDEAEAALNEFMEALNSNDEDALNRIASDAFEQLVYEIVPKDDDKEANNS